MVQRAIRAQEPAEAMRDMGFGDLTLVDSFPVSMSGANNVDVWTLHKRPQLL